MFDALMPTDIATTDIGRRQEGAPERMISRTPDSRTVLPGGRSDQVGDQALQERARARCSGSLVARQRSADATDPAKPQPSFPA
ncbi:MAG: hypothetical protein ABW173_12965, partial [Sphingomonas sp.]